MRRAQLASSFMPSYFIDVKHLFSNTGPSCRNSGLDSGATLIIKSLDEWKDLQLKESNFIIFNLITYYFLQMSSLQYFIIEY